MAAIHTKLNVDDFLNSVKHRNPNEPEFMQAVHEVAECIIPFIKNNKQYAEHRILDRMVEPERVIMFRVPWIDDSGSVRVNRGYRIEMNSAIGPYKGGLRFHPSVNLSILKFLAFEQVFKNSLTTLPMGGGKGGSDFDPKGKTDNEVMRFCQSFMTELFRHIGPDTDVPAGDIGVGAREIGYLFGQYKRIKNEFTGVLTGKSLTWGGSKIRPEATGYGTVYFLKHMLETKGEKIAGKLAAISGSGNVAQFAAEKIIDLGGTVITLSDSGGFIYDKQGIDKEKFEFVKVLKNEKRGRIKEYCNAFDAEYHEGQRPWSVNCDLALPCATQNELDETNAKDLANNGCLAVVEGANMPCTPEAVGLLQAKHVMFAPGKASNAGGVAVSGLEMTQNSIKYQWTAVEVDNKLQEIMQSIHEACCEYGTTSRGVNYVGGANIAGFVKVADAMIGQGVV